MRDVFSQICGPSVNDVFGRPDCFIPRCDESLKPHKDQNFRMIEEGIEFYKKYARFIGFDVRLYRV